MSAEGSMLLGAIASLVTSGVFLLCIHWQESRK